MTPLAPTAGTPRIVACFHCGLDATSPVLAQVGDETRTFCCKACRLAAELIGDQGLSSFYAKREGFGLKPETAQDFPYDDPHFQESISTPQGACMREVVLELSGLHCSACVWLIERILGQRDGIASVRVNFTARRAVILWDPAVIGLGAIAGLLASLGYPASPYDPTGTDRQARVRQRTMLIRLSVAALAALGAMFVGEGLNWGGFDASEHQLRRMLAWIGLAVSTPAALYVGWPFFKSAWTGLRARVLTMDATITLASLTAYLASVWATVSGRGPVYFDCLLALLFFLLLGRALEGSVRRRVLGQAERHWRLAAPSATRLGDEGEETVATAAIRVGDRLLVRPGETIPVDGRVESGSGHVDEAMLSGESVPVSKEPASPVTAGTLNLEGALVIRAEKVGAETTLAQIVKWVSEADAARAPSQVLADKAAVVFLPLLVLVAAVTFWLNWPRGLDAAIRNTISVLIVTCPCALGLATPAAIAVAMARGAREGILFKGGEELERLRAVTHLILDKTGTVTAGRMRVTQVEGEGLALAASLEALSEHPMARAVTAYAREQGIEPLSVEGFKAVPGHGVEGMVQGARVRVGKAAWLGAEAEAEIRQETESRIFVERDGVLVGSLAIADTLRPDATETLDALKGRGIEGMLLSGDRKPVVEAIARALGLGRSFSDVLPDGKRAVVQSQRGPGRTVAMVGDGVNDAPALASADVGIAMGQGAAIAASAAGVVLLGDRLAQLLEAFQLSEATVRTIRANFALSALYNVVAVPIAAMGWVSPQWAAVLMPASSLLVLFNSLRLSR
ncbi:cadmium-translocating P-type ATPase [bacterium]|nr:cadmium-translocating P-type ATPase [bacterium]